MEAAPSHPTLDAPRLVRFDLRAPRAKKVFVAGSFNDWSPWRLALERGADGVWRGWAHLRPGRYRYKFVVDGFWCCDVGPEGPVDTAEGCAPGEFGAAERVLEVRR